MGTCRYATSERVTINDGHNKGLRDEHNGGNHDDQHDGQHDDQIQPDKHDDKAR